MVLPDPAKNTVARSIGDHGDRVLFTDDPAYPGSGRSVTIHAIAVDEDDPARVFVAASAADSPVPGTPASPTLLLGSTDGGRTWSRVAALRLGADLRAPVGRRREGAARARPRRDRRLRGRRAGPGSTSRLPAGPASPPGASAATRARASCSPTPRCRSSPRRGRASPAACRSPRTAAAPGARANGSLLDAVREVGRGESWGPAKGSRPSLGPIAVSAHFPLVAYVGLRGIVLPGRGDAPFNGIAKTTDGGRTWSVVHAESDRPSANLDASWIEPRAAEDGHSVWFDSPYDLAVAPNDPDVAYATDLFRTYRTMDGGRTWAQVNSERRGEDRWTTRGLDVTTTYGIQFDPHDPKRVFIPYTDIGLFRSEDGGETWTGSSTGDPDALAQHDVLARLRPRGEGPRLGRLQRDPRPAAAEDVAAHRPRALPRRRRRLDGRRAATGPSRTGHGGVGDHPRPARPEEPEGQPHALRGGVRARRLQVHRQRAHLGAQERRPRRRPAEPALRLAAHARSGTARSTSSSPAAASAGASATGTTARSTARRTAPRPGSRWRCRRARTARTRLTVDPEDPKRLYLSAWGVTHPDGDTGGGIFLSTDAGATWRNVLPEAQHVYDVTVDPRDPKRALRLRLRPGGLPLDRPRRDLDADPRLQLQVGPAGDPRPRGRRRRSTSRRSAAASGTARRRATRARRRTSSGDADGPSGREDPRHGRIPRALEQLVEANILGTHAFQVALAKKEGKGDPACYSPGSLTDAQLAAHRDAPGRAAEGRREGGARLGGGQAVGLRPEGRPRAAPRLGARARRHAARERLHAVAGRADEGPARAGARASPASSRRTSRWSATGTGCRSCSRSTPASACPSTSASSACRARTRPSWPWAASSRARACASPFGTAAADWQIAGRKNWNWGEKNLGIRDDKVLARGAARGAGREGPRPADPGAAGAADRGDRATRSRCSCTGRRRAPSCRS